jgi:hypothetical protein
MKKLSLGTSALKHDLESCTTFMVHVRSVSMTSLHNSNHIANPTIGFMLAWSVVSLLTYLAHDFHSMLVCRFILGITEAPVRRIHHNHRECKPKLTLTSSILERYT